MVQVQDRTTLVADLRRARELAYTRAAVRKTAALRAAILERYGR